MGAAHPNGEPADPAGVWPPVAAGELVLVRHGQGECNAAGVIGGPEGCRGLTPRGRIQSLCLAQRLAELNAVRRFDVLLSSPRLRAFQCAQIIGDRLARHVTVVDTLRGQEFGAADGRSWEHVIRGFGGPPMNDPDRPIAEGAESWNAYAERVLAALTSVLAEYSGRRVLLVGHGKTTGLAGALLSGALLSGALLSGAADPSSGVSELIVDHGGLSHWRRRADQWHLLVHNDTRHLSAEQVPQQLT